jgi:hypothetical protein
MAFLRIHNPQSVCIENSSLNLVSGGQCKKDRAAYQFPELTVSCQGLSMQGDELHLLAERNPLASAFRRIFIDRDQTREEVEFTLP